MSLSVMTFSFSDYFNIYKYAHGFAFICRVIIWYNWLTFALRKSTYHQLVLNSVKINLTEQTISS